jgi:hypothetical protein
MKDKKEQEKKQRNQHKVRLKAVKEKSRLQALEARFATPIFREEEGALLEKKNFLIVCVGENTEPQYFEKFKPTRALVIPLTKAYDPLSQAQWTCNAANIRKIEREEAKKRGLENFTFDEIWCVFDKDDFDAGQFNNAVTLCGQNNVGCAFSNEAFELWLILHFENLHAPYGRQDYKAKLNGHLNPLGLDYTDSKNVSDELFSILSPLLETAKRNARNGYLFHSTQGHTPAQSQSATTVYKLVTELQKYS